MRKGIFSEELGGTAGCVMRGAINTSVFKYHTSKKDDDNNEEIKEPEEPLLHLGDSWFESVKTCINIGKTRYHGFFIVNQKHFEQEIKDYSRGEGMDNNREEIRTKWNGPD